MTTLHRLLATLTAEPADTRFDGPDALRRRRIVVIVFLVIGAVILGISLSAEPGDTAFYPLTIALAATWIIGGFLSGPIHLGRAPGASAALGIVTGVVVGAVFVVGALVTREIPVLRDLVSQVLAFRDQGSLAAVTAITLGNGLAEEVFFRGAVYSAVQRHRAIVISTLLYVLATLASGNPMLGFAAVLLGAVCAVLRRRTDGVLAPICTHVVWGAIVLFALPPLFA